MKNKKNPQQQEGNVEEEARALGKKLVLLLRSSDLPEEVQISIIHLLPEMTLEQIDELVNVLTENVARGGEMDEGLKQRLGKVKEKYDSKREDLADSIMKDLDDLEKEIDKYS
ncbi:hypothetical protein KKB10_04165 [Patescibacteria group bacterium]|nr:hypothetical protein [Patescibacteria group bacterium]